MLNNEVLVQLTVPRRLYAHTHTHTHTHTHAHTHTQCPGFLSMMEFFFGGGGVNGFKESIRVRLVWGHAALRKFRILVPLSLILT